MRLGASQRPPGNIQLAGEISKRLQQIRAVRQSDIAPHLGRTGRHSSGITKPGTAELALAGSGPGENTTRQTGSDELRQMARPAEKLVVIPRRTLKNPAADSFPKGFYRAESGAMRAPGRGNDANLVEKQVSPSSADAASLPTGNGVAANEMNIRAAGQTFERMNHERLRTPHIRDESSGQQERQRLGHQRSHLGKRCAEYNEVGVFNSLGQVESGDLDRADFPRLVSGGRAADESDDSFGQAALLEGESKRPSQETDTDQSNLFPTHGWSFGFAEGGFKSRVTDP